MHLILAAIKRYLQGANYIHSDARNTKKSTDATRSLPDAGTQRKLPAAVLPLHLQTSFPDILMIDLPTREVATLQRQKKSIPRLTRNRCTINIIEVKYTFDLLIHERTRQAMEQHAQLRENLLAAGWGTVNIHPFIIGSAGTIRYECHSILNQCGVTEEPVRDLLLRKIAIHSVKRTAEIVQARLRHKAPDLSSIAHASTPPPAAGEPPPDIMDESEDPFPPPLTLSTPRPLFQAPQHTHTSTHLMTHLVMDPAEARGSASPQSVSTIWIRQLELVFSLTTIP